MLNLTTNTADNYSTIAKAKKATLTAVAVAMLTMLGCRSDPPPEEGGNTPPVASSATFNAENDSSVSGQLVAADAQNDPITYRLISQASGGTATVEANGGFAYDPRADFTGTDSFTFRANDGQADSNLATITVIVAEPNEVPVAQSQSVTTGFQTQASGNLVATDGDGDALTFRLFEQASNGTAVVNSGGSFTYSPNTGFSGTDVFTFRANDGRADSNTATVTVTVNDSGNSTPSATSSSFSTAASTTLNDSVTGTDADGDPLTFAVVDNPGNGTLTLNSDGSFSYTSDDGFSGIDTFTFTASDGTATSAPATASIDVGNAAPTVADQTFTGNEDELLTATIVASDPNSDTLTYELVTGDTAGPNSGEIRNFDTATGEFTYLPERDFEGTDSFDVQVNDGRGGTDTATITLTIACPNVGGECDFDKLPPVDLLEFTGARQPSIIVQTPASSVQDITRPYVAYIENAGIANSAPNNLIVRRFTGGAWETVDEDGDGVVDRNGQASKPDIKPALILPLTVAVAWDEAGDIFVDRYADLIPGWENISGPPNQNGGTTNANARDVSLAINTLSEPLVSFVEGATNPTGDAVIYANTGNTAELLFPANWELLNQSDGALDVTDSNAVNSVSIAADDLVGAGLGSLSGRPIIAFSEVVGGVSKIFVKRCNDTDDTGAACELLGPASGSVELNIDPATDANNPSAAVASFLVDLNVRPIAAFDEGGNVYVRRFDGTNWVTLGSSVNGGAVDVVLGDTATKPAVAVDLLGRIVVAWQEVESVSGVSRVYVKRYDEANEVYEQLGSILNCDIDENAVDIDVAFDTLARPYVAFTEEDTSATGTVDTRIVVLRFTQQ